MSNRKRHLIPIFYALLAALFYGIGAPISKLLLAHISPYLMSSLLYFGAGFGMLIVTWVKPSQKKERLFASFGKKDIKYIILMILLDIAAPILLMIGLTKTTASTASLLNNLEIVFTALIALVFFKEVIGWKMWLAISCIVLAGVLLSFDSLNSLHLSVGALFVIAASLGWGLENNCTRMLSHHNPLHVVIIKGFGSGLGALMIALALNQFQVLWYYLLLALLLGFVAYGMSLYYYISAQRHLGAARTSAYYSTAPFVGALVSFLILKEALTSGFVIAFIVMAIGAYLAIKENQTMIHPDDGIH